MNKQHDAIKIALGIFWKRNQNAVSRPDTENANIWKRCSKNNNFLWLIGIEFQNLQLGNVMSSFSCGQRKRSENARVRRKPFYAFSLDRRRNFLKTYPCRRGHRFKGPTKRIRKQGTTRHAWWRDVKIWTRNKKAEVRTSRRGTSFIASIALWLTQSTYELHSRRVCFLSRKRLV